MNFTLNEKTSQPQQVPFGKDLALVIGLYPDQVQATEHPQTLNDTWDRLGNQAIVGDGSLLSGGVDLRTVAGTTAGGLIQGEEYQVVGVMRDSRCPGASYWDDRFDND
jgi:hypothetical protein